MRSTLLPLSLLALAVSTLPASAQRSETSSWDTFPLPPNSSVSSIGTSALIQTPNEVIFYSGILRQWVSQAVSAPSISLYNAFATVVDGNTVYGWASRRGVVAPLSVSPGFSIVTGPTTSGWLAIVVDGNTVHGFSAFQGRWVSQTLAGPVQGGAATSLVGVIHDGVNAWGFSAYSGTWTAQPDPNPRPSLSVSGVVATSRTGGIVHAYSAQKDAWASTTASAGAQLTVESGYALIEDGQDFTAFCGYRAQLATYTATDRNARALPFREFCLVEDGTTFAGCAGSRGTWQTLPIAMPQAIVDANSEVALITSPPLGLTVGFSGVTGNFSPPIIGNYTTETDESVGWCRSLTDAYGYSPILDGFVRLPLDPNAVQSVTTLRSSVIVQTATGHLAMTTRQNRWVELVGSGILVTPRGGRGATALVVDTGRAHAWDARIGRWSTTSLGTNPNFSVFRVVNMAIDDEGTGYGFGLFSGEWETVRIQGGNPSVRASSSIGLIRTDTHVHVYSAHGTLSNPSRFPEFSRIIDRGGDLRLIQAGTPRSVVNTLFGVAPDYRPTLFGTLFVDLGAPTVNVQTGVIDTSGRLDLTLPIPDEPALIGTQLHIQNFIVPPSGRAYLTNSTSPVIV